MTWPCTDQTCFHTKKTRPKPSRQGRGKQTLVLLYRKTTRLPPCSRLPFQARAPLGAAAILIPLRKSKVPSGIINPPAPARTKCEPFYRSPRLWGPGRAGAPRVWFWFVWFDVLVHLMDVMVVAHLHKHCWLLGPSDESKPTECCHRQLAL